MIVLPEKKRAKISINTASMLAAVSAMIIINAVSWLSPQLTDLYADRIFSPVSNVLARVTGAVPFSLGEVMIAVGILLVIAAPILFISSIIRQKRAFVKHLGIFYCWVLIFIFVTETLNCFVLYHTTEFSEKYHGGAGSGGFTVNQLSDMCEETISAANELALIVNRDSDGNMIVPENMRELAEISMNRISSDYAPLAGKYPDAKKIACSMLMTQLDLQGIYFPFSLEANYNRELSPARVPCTIMHEFSHLKGFIREDEACFIAYRACIASDVPEVRYSGYLSAMNYLLNAVYANASESDIIRLCNMISNEVRRDNIFVSDDYLKKIEEKAVISTKTVNAVSVKAMETTLKLNGVSDGKKSYGRMVNLLLEYHYYIEEKDTVQ